MHDTPTIFHRAFDDEPAILASWPTATEPAAVRLRLLVVEDNPNAANTLGLFLELYGHSVRVALAGACGIREALEWRPDAVLCDLGMPGWDGFRVAQLLAAMPATHGSRLVALSPDKKPETLRRASEAGFHHYLTKPVAPNDLLRVLRTIG